jgi:hypothetical protein
MAQVQAAGGRHAVTEEKPPSHLSSSVYSLIESISLALTKDPCLLGAMFCPFCFNSKSIRLAYICVCTYALLAQARAAEPPLGCSDSLVAMPQTTRVSLISRQGGEDHYWPVHVRCRNLGRNLQERPNNTIPWRGHGQHQSINQCSPILEHGSIRQLWEV